MRLVSEDDQWLLLPRGEIVLELGNFWGASDQQRDTMNAIIAFIVSHNEIHSHVIIIIT